MPYASTLPLRARRDFEATFPADFIAEGLDQTRGWFYTLMVLSTALFDKPPSATSSSTAWCWPRTAKMSKRLKNYPDPAT
jgi:isoleucyl-tRNA synthetase